MMKKILIVYKINECSFDPKKDDVKLYKLLKKEEYYYISIYLKNSNLSIIIKRGAPMLTATYYSIL